MKYLNEKQLRCIELMVENNMEISTVAKEIGVMDTMIQSYEHEEKGLFHQLSILSVTWYFRRISCAITMKTHVDQSATTTSIHSNQIVNWLRGFN